MYFQYLKTFSLHPAFTWESFGDFGWDQKEQSSWQTTALHRLLPGWNGESECNFLLTEKITEPVAAGSDIITIEQCWLLLLSSKRGNDGSSFNEDQLCAYLLDLHFAGTDTTANTVLSAILYLMVYPQIQGMYSFRLSLFTVKRRV